ncbi:hypothetical protein TUN199_10380 [Pyrenophora tritici-repentis]|nr:hypothetical protein PtrV1_06475 [Pyrenophora tritici-repentis]KAI0605724.1 hypothetical protein TUN205_10026 [Pyrenophora tritici-repentis]KAI0617630.1 hypothetical protein TUN199_10380 [Pyrenophora tritici-repentis]PZD27991.1 hypothetical protein A1F96_06271 [Pyrenophora tritici-repentis]
MVCGLFHLFNSYITTAFFATVLALFGVGNAMALTDVNDGIQAIAEPADPVMAACIVGSCAAWAWQSVLQQLSGTAF